MRYLLKFKQIELEDPNENGNGDKNKPLFEEGLEDFHTDESAKADENQKEDMK